MTEPTAPDLEPSVELEVLHPLTGELVDLGTATPRELDVALQAAGDFLSAVYAFRDAVVGELCRRADRAGARTVELGGVKWEVNAPTVDDFDLGVLRTELGKLVEAGTIDQALLDAVLPQKPRPPAPPPAVDKRRVNVLLKSDNRELIAALAAARQRVPQKRTAKVLERAVDAQEAGHED